MLKWMADTTLKRLLKRLLAVILSMMTWLSDFNPLTSFRYATGDVVFLYFCAIR